MTTLPPNQPPPELVAQLQAAIDAARDLARAAQAGAHVDCLDQLAGQVIQLTGTFRAALRARVVHRRVVCDELGYAGAACLADGGELTTNPAAVTCPKCRAAAPHP
jgi:hypothetical protein